MISKLIVLALVAISAIQANVEQQVPLRRGGVRGVDEKYEGPRALKKKKIKEGKGKSKTSSDDSPPPPPPPGCYARRLDGFDEASLYDFVEDAEFREVSMKHIEYFAEIHETHVRPCAVRESKHFGEDVTINDCIDPDSRVGPDVHPDFEAHYEPWLVPKIDGATLIAKNPGIWTIDDFLSEEEVDKFIEIMMRNGEEGMFGPCTDAGKNPMTSQPSTNKMCYMIGPENMCEGPYHYSTCSHKTKPDDGEFIKMIQDRAQGIMSLQKEVDFEMKHSEFFKLHRATGNTPPQLLHEDSYDIISFLIYLSDDYFGLFFFLK